MGTPTQYFVDPSLGSDTGNGTVGTPWGRASGSVIQWALDTGITRDGTNGDQINVKAGTDDVLASPLSLASYGTPGDGEPLIFRGYTSAGNDGGVGGISGNNSVAIIAIINYVQFVDLHLHDCGSADIVPLGLGGAVLQCEVDETTGSGIVIGGARCSVERNNTHNCGTYGIYDNGGSTSAAKILFNYLKNGANDFVDAIRLFGGGSVCERNIISVDGSTNGIVLSDENIVISHNSILSSSGTGKGIVAGTGTPKEAVTLINNLVEGFIGAGGVGIDDGGNGDNGHIIGNNAAFNNTTDFSLTTGEYALSLGDNEALGATPYDKSGSNTFANRFTYFAPVDTGNVRGGAYPSGSRLDKGAVQHADPAGGGGGGSCHIIGG